MQSTISSPILKQGSVGQAVNELQALLNQQASRDQQLTVDGVFGPKTEALVKTFQRIYFLAVDGIVGPKSWKSFRAAAPTDLPTLGRGSRGELVERVQQVLNLGSQAPIAVDGIYGAQTEAAVIMQQNRNGREIDRNGKVIIGPKTWLALSQRLAYFTFSL
jgi:peptidoglycan hydrolase-like protein with peptidoglycan-binding domain